MIQYLNRLFLFATLATVTVLTAACGGSSTGPGNDNEPTTEETFQVNIDVSPSEAGTISPSLDSTYTEGEEIEFMANANADYVFSGWRGDVGVDENPLTLTVDEAYDLTATFEVKNYDLEINTEGEGVVSEVLKQKSKDYESGTVVELVAIPEKGHRFVEWRGHVTGTGNPIEVTVDNPKEVTAVFEEEPEKQITYDVRVNVTPSGAGSISPSLDSTYAEGEDIQLSASANDNYVFTHWSGGVDSTAENPLNITADKAYSLTAHYKPKTYDLAVNTVGEGVVSEAISQQAKGYESGTVVDLVATPDENYRFVEWKGDLSGTDNPAEITVDNPKEVTAVFEKKSYELALVTIGQGAISEQVVQAKSYDHGTVIELTADTATGWVFTGWQGDLDGTENPVQITVTEKTTVVAKFDLPFYLADNGVTVICSDAEVGDSGTVNEVTYTKRTAAEIEADPSLAPTSCTSGITDMSSLFSSAGSFNGDISHWDVSSVSDMTTMFSNAQDFNQDIGRWDVSGVVDMYGMFQGALSFNQDLEDWDVSNVTNMSRLFIGSRNFNGDISSWDVSSVERMSQMFLDASAFSGDISHWDVSSVTDITAMFSGADSFNADIGSWDVSGVTTMYSTFQDAKSFNQDIGSWDVSNVTDWASMFEGAESFNQDIGGWDVSGAAGRVMSSMFYNATNFNQDLTGWCVEDVDSEPNNFSSGSSLTEDNEPIWGTCP